MFFWLKGKTGWLIALFILIVICIFLFYSLIDQSVSLDYAHQDQIYKSQEIKVLRSLLLETGKGMSRSDIEALVTRKIGKDKVKKEEQDELWIEGGIVLKFKGDSLVEVRSLNEDP
ncbi:MAG: hypothetical protein L0196_05555 [candidate division Zixibacteria bacterium]|nr:hypothetical protein [candidate division Zixibacteria bacterium]